MRSLAFFALLPIAAIGFLFPGAGNNCCGNQNNCCGVQSLCPTLPEPDKPEPEKPVLPPPPVCHQQCPCQCPPSVIYYPQPVPTYLVGRPPGFYATPPSPPLPPPPPFYPTTPLPPVTPYTQTPYSATYIGPAAPPGHFSQVNSYKSPSYETNDLDPTGYNSNTLLRFIASSTSQPNINNNNYGYTLAPYGTEHHAKARNAIQKHGRIKRAPMEQILFAECDDEHLKESLAQALTGSDFGRDDGRILFQLPIRSSLVVFCSRGNLAVSELDNGHRVCTLSKNDVNCAVVS